MKTTKAKLTELKVKADKALKAYRVYKKQYNTEHDVERPHLSDEIVTLYRNGLDKAAIVKKGYNVNYVNQTIRFYEKGKRVQKTAVAHYFPKPKKK